MTLIFTTTFTMGFGLLSANRGLLVAGQHFEVEDFSVHALDAGSQEYSTQCRRELKRKRVPGLRER